MHSKTPESVEALLAAMVGFDTVSAPISGIDEAERPLSEYLEWCAREWQFEVTRHPVPGFCHNLLIRCEIAPELPWLLFVSHLDTVAVENMIIAPFTAAFTDDRIYGRGACDTKGSGAAMFAALREYRDSASSQPNNIALLFSVNEEAGMKGISTFASQTLPELPFRPSAAIVGEPTMLRPVIANNGALRSVISVHGQAAHSSNPAKGRSAISDMARLITALEEDYIANLSARHALTGQAQCSINLIRGGTEPNVIPALCTVSMDRRMVPGEEPKAVQREIEQFIDAFAATRTGMRAGFEVQYCTPPLVPIAGSSFYAEIETVLRAVHGTAVESFGVSFGTEGGFLCGVGIPTVVLGPGDLTQAHTVDEWLSREQLASAVKVYEQCMAHRYND